MSVNKDKAIAILSQLLANTYVLYNKTQNYHWNLKGKEFITLHRFFQEHYEDFQQAIDDTAETMLMLGTKTVDGTLSKMLSMSSIKENDLAKGQGEIIKDLIQDHKTMLEFLEKSVENPEIGAFCADFLVKRIGFHSKVLWMLQSSL